MLLAALVLALGGADAPREHVARTEDGRRVVVTVRDRRVRRVRVGLRSYRCETFGQLGPVVVDERGDGRLRAGGRFRFVGGPSAQRLVVSGRLRAGRLRGELRVTGTIATGQRCASGRVRFG